MKQDTKDIGMLNGIEFSVWTEQDILDASVCHVIEKKVSIKDSKTGRTEIVENGLRDPRLGPITGKCKTCDMPKNKCQGHFGHITLCEYVYHISWITQVIYWLKATCYSCSAILIKDITKYSGPRNRMMQRFVKSLHTKCPECQEKQPKYSWNKEKNQITRNNKIFPIDEVRALLCKIPDDLIHNQLKISHPKDMIIRVLPVPPPTVRPPILAGNSIRGEDDLTYRLIQILRINEKLVKIKTQKRPGHVGVSAKEQLQLALTGYINHKKLVNARKRSSKREYGSITSRFTKKEGRIRGNLMGKRCDFTGRTVITGDDNLGMHEVGIPISVAEKLTVPIVVTSYNKKTLQKQLEGPKSSIKFVKRPNGSRVDLSFVPRSSITLDVGFTIERSLKDGDIVLFNRQPSLHKMSIMAHEVRVLPYSTFRMNLSCTTPYNADFDGDEMNIHVLQTVQSQAEARNIMAVKYQIVSPQSNRPVMSVIQDTLVGAYLLSTPGLKLSKETMFQCAMQIPDWDGKIDVKDEYDGKELISLVLPMVNWKRNNVEILRGKLIKGQLTKKVLGTSHGSLIHVIFQDCGPDETILFIHRLQMIVHSFLTKYGFSIGIKDIVVPKRITDAVHNEVDTAFNDIRGETDENKINARLNQCRDSMGKLVQEPLSDKNSFYVTVTSGSKGSTHNISQIMAIVGQQNLNGKRIPKTWSNRTLPHYLPGSNGPSERGFVAHSFTEGLTPSEYFFLAISGREGVIDTACKTSVTGYLQRRFMKALENLKVNWDKTVRNSGGTIFQFKYGDDGIDAMSVELQKIDTWVYPTVEKYGGIDEEYQQILLDHEFLKGIDKWKDPNYSGGADFMLPIPVKRIIHNAKTLFGFPSKPIDIQTVYKKTCELLDTMDNMMWKILIRSELNSNRIVNEHKCTKDEFDIIIHEIKKKFDSLICAPGESVGGLAAQSLGEPATQMTLNTFHSAGISSMNVTLGIPRLEECINCSKNIKTPLTEFTADDMQTIVKNIKHISLNDLVESYKLTETPNDSEVGMFHIFPDTEYEPHENSSTLVLYIKEWNDVKLIKEAIYGTEKVVCAYSDDSKPVFHVKCHNKFPDIDLGMFYEQKMKTLTVRGIPGGEIAQIVELPGKPPMIQTSLRNFHALFEYEFHYNNLYCNDVHVIAKTYGIEAARNVLLKEIRGILCYYGIYVNVRHMLILIDWMTHSGVLTPLTRHGIRDTDASPLKRSTFEEVIDVFNKAAAYNEVDNLEGNSECIIAGVPPNIGSNMAEMIKDEVVERKYAIPRPVTPVTTLQWDNDEPWVKMDDEKDIYGNVQQDPWADQRNPWEQTMGGFNANPFGTMGGMMQPQPLGFTNPWNTQPVIPGMQFAPVIPGMQSHVPPPVIPVVPQWQQVPQSPTYDPNRPESPQYDPNKPPSPVWNSNLSYGKDAYDPTDARPTSPTYDPNQPPEHPKSPEYHPTSPTYSPTSPAYSPHSPTSPAYTPTSPTSPCYSPTSPSVPHGPSRSPNGDSYSPMSPAYSPGPQDQQAPMYDPEIPFLPELKLPPRNPNQSNPKKRKSFLE